MEPETTTTETAPNGAAPPPLPRGFPPLAIRAPAPARAKPAVIGVEIGAELADDGTLPMKVAAGAITAARETWAAACELHVQLLGKVSPILPEVAQQLKSREWFYNAKQRTLKSCDAALAEIRRETKEIEVKIERQTVPPRAQGDVAGAVLASEVRSWLRSASEAERLSLVERAIAAGDVRLVGAALEVPLLAGLTPERAALLLGRWRKARCPEELARLELLQQTAEKVEQAGQRLQRRFDEGFDHVGLDRLEPSSKAAA